jgi:hypothetical protein
MRMGAWIRTSSGAVGEVLGPDKGGLPGWFVVQWRGGVQGYAWEGDDYEVWP